MRVDVVVVGGGIGGLAAANALARVGASVRVLEQAPEFGEVGAGLQLAPNATRILREWGLLDEVVEAGVLPRRLVLRDALDGGELTHLDLGDAFRRRYGAPYVVVHRSDLHRVLLDACRRAGVDLLTDRRAERVDAEGDAVLTRCADGSVHASSVVLGVDGLMSTLRRAVVDDEPVASGFVAYRGTVPVDALAVDVDLDDVVAWIGPDRHFVQYALRQREILNQVAVFRSPALARGGTGGPEELDAAFSDCCAHVRTSLAYMWRDRWWPMYDREPVGRWVAGRLALLGDAAHPMLQYLAQGACQAMEDAHALAGAVAAARCPAPAGAGGSGARTTAAFAVEGGLGSGVDWDAALLSTQRARAGRAARVQRTARTWGEIWHLSGTARLVRNELLTTRDPADLRHVDWLYGG
jgi:3-hydroxybenzoate 6-monooxygenase